MTADGYRAGQGWHPGSMALAGSISLAAVAAIAFSAPVVELIRKHKPIVIDIVPEPPVPPEVSPPPSPKPHQLAAPSPLPTPAVARPITIVPRPAPDPGLGLTPDPAPLPTGPGGGSGTIEGGTGAGVVLPKLPSILTVPTVDPRYAAEFQPAFPPEEVRAGRQGRVIVRVLVGIDGRVRRVERIEATSDAFYAVTERQALRHWRFRPAMRDGVPIEAERHMSVTFVLHE